MSSAFLSFAKAEEDKYLKMVVDSGCDHTLVPPSYQKYVVESKPCKATIRVANDQVINIDKVHLLALPVFDNECLPVTVLEPAYISSSVPVGLLSLTANRPIKVNIKGQMVAVGLRGAVKG